MSHRPKSIREYLSQQVIKTDAFISVFNTLPVERIQAELYKMFKVDTEESMKLLLSHPRLSRIIFGDKELKLVPTLKKLK